MSLYTLLKLARAPLPVKILAWRPAVVRRPCKRWLALVAVATCLAGAGGGAIAAAPASVYLEDLTWTELRDAVAQGKTTALVPIGGTEQSGPALALGKHNARVRLLAGRIAGELGNALVAPVLAYVPEGSVEPPTSHMRFPGTLTVPPAVFAASLQSIGRSLRAAGFRDIVFIGDHGGYQGQLSEVAARLNHEWTDGRARAYAPPAYYRAASEGFARILREHGYRDDEIGTHAALADTALQLAVDPVMVRQDVIAAGHHLGTSDGVYGGDPTRASAALGQLGLDNIVRESVAAIRADILATRHGGPPGR